MAEVLFEIPEWLDYADYDNYPSESKPTTNADFINYSRNQNKLVGALTSAFLWQPNTNFIAGKIIITPNMPEGMEAVALTGGFTGTVEPAWESDVAEYQDSGVKWQLRYRHWSKDVEQITDLTTGATNRLPNTTYAVGNVVYNRSNLSVALKCTQTGTTSNTELDISGRAVGESVEDGSVVWEVVPRFLPAATINEIANELIEELFVGFIGTYAGKTPPAGWLSCEGASLNPQTYTRLFGRIGTTYGGDGSTTFNLPNLGSNLVSDVATGNIPVAGNGKALGLTLGKTTDRSPGGLYASGSGQLYVYKNLYGASVGTGSSGLVALNGALGIDTDSTKSGIVAKMTATKTTVKYCIKY